MDTWIYKQRTGELWDPKGVTVAHGYAGGDCGKRPDGVNNPALENVPCVGPLPAGVYEIGTPRDSAHLGPFAIPLMPRIGTETFGRSGFFIHGDKVGGPPQSASEGCIILPRAIRELIAVSLVKTLTVVKG